MSNGRRVGALALGLAMVASAVSAAEAYGLKAARTALSGRSEAVIVAVPRSWVRADSKLGADEAETAGDWSFYFQDWLRTRHQATNVVVVTPAELRQLVDSPKLPDKCTTVFLRDRTHALIFTNDCVLTQADYAAGDEWLRTGKGSVGDRQVEIRLR